MTKKLTLRGTAPFKKIVLSSIYTVLGLRLLFMMGIFMLCRFIFYLFNQSYFANLSVYSWLRLLQGGIRFDLAAVLYINALYIALILIPFKFKYHRIYQGVLSYLFFITNSLAILTNCIDIVYFRFTLRRTTSGIFREFRNENNMASLTGEFIVRYWYVVVIWILLVWLIVWGYRKIKTVSVPSMSSPKLFFFQLLLIPVIGTLFIGGVRGGFTRTTRPITLSNAGEYVDRPKEMVIVLNTPFCILRTLKKTDYERVQFFSDEELPEIYNPVHRSIEEQTFRPLNVVIIIWESFGKESVGYFNRHLENGTYKGFTPFIDSLITQSKTFRYSFANGIKSIEAIPSVLAGIPNIRESFVLTRYTGNTVHALPGILNTKGYHTSFFHGAPNGSMGFQAIVNLFGVKHYFGKTEYNNDNDFDGYWGIWDEEFMQFWAKKMNTFPEPFMSTVFTVSSHDPYKIPDRYKGKFPQGPLPIYQSLSYTDHALKRFFETARKMPWFRNTLFVITADHAATFAHYPEYKTSVGSFCIPIIFYSPSDSTLRGTDEKTIAQQIDILPSILDYLHYDKPYFAFGKNILSEKIPELNFTVNYDGAFQWYNGSYMLQFDGKKSLGLYKYSEDKLLKKNILDREFDTRNALEKQVKAFIQQYQNRMIDDKLTVR